MSGRYYRHLVASAVHVTCLDVLDEFCNKAYSCSSLTSVTIPQNVTIIGASTFAYCNSLITVTIPNGVTTIGNDAFYQCENLTSVTIPDSVKNIEQQAFQSCASLTSVTIGNGVNTIGDRAFSSCSMTSMTIPGSVTAIGNGSFLSCNNLTSITFLGMVAPTVGEDWIAWTGEGIVGHAYSTSNFPSTGGDFNGLNMGAAIPDDSNGNVDGHKPSTSGEWITAGLIVVALAVLIALLVIRRRKVKK
jgi:hypothetical protein